MMKRFWIYLTTVAYLLEDRGIGLLQSAGVKLRPLGNRMHKISVDQAVGYHEGVWAVYRHYLPSRPPAHCCEIGPGDSLGMGVLFASQGAEQVTFIDRFNIRPEVTRDREICTALFRRHAEALAPRFANAEALTETIRVVEGVWAERYFAEANPGFDFICSSAVLEHLDDPLRALTGMYDSLPAGGVMVHIVDLRNHKLFRRLGPLTWLETPASLHRLIRRNTAKPNRVLFHAYKRWAQGRPGVEFFVRNLAGSDRDFGGARVSELPAEDFARARELISSRRKRFAPPHRDEPVEDLAVSVFILVATKAAAYGTS